MILRPLHRWEYTPNLEGLLYFAQRMDEMLFDYTLDTYKPAALNAPHLCLETLGLIEDIEQGLIEKSNLKYALEELIWALQHDEVAKTLLELDKGHYVSDPETQNLEEQKVKLQLLTRALNPRRYIQAIEQLLLAAVANPKEKQLIDLLAQSYVTTLRNFGYHHSFIYGKVLDFFYSTTGKKITKVDDLRDFFALFDLKSRKYDVVFVVSGLFGEVKDAGKTFNIEIDASPSDDGGAIATFARTRRAEHLLLKVKDVDAYDCNSARESAQHRIEFMASLFVLFHHKHETWWQQKALVLGSDPPETIVLENPVSPMKKGVDLKPSQAALQLEKVVKDFSMHTESLIRFARVIDLHRLAVQNDVLENQLLNLWTAFETFVPSRPNKTKIQNVVDSLLPFLKTGYAFRLIDDLAKDLINWNGIAVNHLLDRVPHHEGKTLVEKVALLLVIPENEPLRSELYASLGNFVLLRNRCHILAESLKDSQSVRALVVSHERKVAWQMRRIYRTRNLIVHSNRVPPYTAILVENAHSYLDMFLSQLLELAKSPEGVNTIAQAVELTAMKIKSYEDYLKSKDQACCTDNIAKILFARDVGHT